MPSGLNLPERLVGELTRDYWGAPACRDAVAAGHALADVGPEESLGGEASPGRWRRQPPGQRVPRRPRRLQGGQRPAWPRRRRLPAGDRRRRAAWRRGRLGKRRRRSLTEIS